MRKALASVLLLLLLTGCQTRADRALYASGGAAVPVTAGEPGAAKEDGESGEVGEGEAPEPRYVALTFDDGPRPDTTGPLLEGLAQRGVTATFFVIGEQVPGNEELIRRMVRDGHQVGSHTYSHVRLGTAEKNTVIEEIQKTEVVLSNALGSEGEYWLRPPYGIIDKERSALIKTPMIYWSLDPQDWKKLDAGRVTEYVVNNVQGGDIVLLHDFYPTSVQAALRIVDRLQAEGYIFVTVEQLFALEGVTPQPGLLYASPVKLRPVK